MGQTLSHGVYLPNEGERNCYAGMASNWQILNTAVGNIAEKAPLVHTHGNISSDGKVGTNANRPLITGTGGAVQAGAFGNQANTFCEGNDSRLSDARTPVAHTHTKSDVTDLLNSNFIPSANNSYGLGSSSYQWKSLNGVNPGALSLPSGGTTENTDWYNVAGDILPTGGNATNFTGGANLFTPSKDGWLALSVVSCESIAVWVLSLNYGLSVVAPSANDNRQLIIPVVAGKQIEIKVKGTRWYSARLIMPKGNV